MTENQREAGIWLLVAFILAVFLYFTFSETRIDPEYIIHTYGLFGLFFAAIIANASIIFPISIELVVLPLGTNPALIGLPNDNLARLAIGLVSGTGAAFGEMTGYILGLLGHKAVESSGQADTYKLGSIREKIKSSGMLFIFLGAFTPFPFDIIGVASGLIRYNPVKFFIAAWAGKVLRYMLIAFAGFLGLEFVKTLFFI